MSTKDYCLPSNGTCNDFGIDTLNDQYNNLNLNQNNYGTNLTFVQSKTVINHAKKFTNYDNLPNKNNSKAKYKCNLNSWNKSPNLLNVQNYSDKKGFPTNDSKNSNRSTLSLHISAYENSVKEISDSSGLKKEKSNLIQPFFAVGFTIQNPFEFPRQQENEKSKKPGIVQFKASQRLLNPNQTSGNSATLRFPHLNNFVKIRN